MCYLQYDEYLLLIQKLT